MCVCVCVRAYVCMCLYVYMYMYVCVFMNVYMYVCVCIVGIPTHMDIRSIQGVNMKKINAKMIIQIPCGF